ncbi:MAG: Gfo/Idh/MocA family oxidoreductase [Rhodocyclaceae bacterium]
MNLHRLLGRRLAEGRPLRLALIGAGKFGSMYLAQARRTPGVHVAAIADLAPERAFASLRRTGWPDEQFAAVSLTEAFREGSTFVCEDAFALIRAQGIDLVIEATGNPAAGVAHALSCSANGKSVVMVNVEADALAGPLLAERAREAGAVYSLAYGDQPALVCEMVDWARTAGFEVVAAGKGTKYLPAYHRSTPDTVWEHYGFSAQQVAAGDFNAKMFNSFLDGTKSAIEMAALANATGLAAASGGLAFPPCGVDDLARVLRPREDGGMLEAAGQVEVISSLERDGSPVARDLRWGVFVAIAAPSDYVRSCFAQYGVATDDSGRYAVMYRPVHLIGLELGISVASVGLRKEPTGCPIDWRADAVAAAKRGLRAGETLDGEGGYTVYGRLMPAAESSRLGALPIGLAHGVRLVREIAEDGIVRWEDVAIDENLPVVRTRREMERMFAADPDRPCGSPRAHWR